MSALARLVFRIAHNATDPTPFWRVDVAPTPARVRRGAKINLLAYSTTPCCIHVEENGGWHITVPYGSTIMLRCDGHTYDLAEGATALLLPNIRREAERQTSSTFIASFQLASLLERIAAMSGAPDIGQKLDVWPHQLELNDGRKLFLVLTHICRLIDTIGANA